MALMGSARIFVVEDEAVVAFEMSDALEDLGFEVVGPSIHLGDATAQAEKQDFDVAVLDVNLGRSKTTEPVVRILKEREIPYVFLTAYDPTHVDFVCEEDRVLRKPVSINRLVAALRRTISEHD